MKLRIYVGTKSSVQKRSNPLISILAIVGGITAGNLASEGMYTSSFIAAIVTTAVVAILMALSDYEEWDERREKNLAVAAKHTLIATIGTLIIAGASMAIPTPAVGIPLLSTGFAVLFIWVVVYQYMEWRDTH